MSKLSTHEIELKQLNVPAIYLYINSLFFIGLLSNSPTTRRLLFLLLLASSIHALFYRSLPPGDLSTFSNIATLVFRASDALFLNDPTELRRVGQTLETNKLRFGERARWAFDFLTNMRRIGWTDEPRHILPPHPTESRWKFVRSRIGMVLWYIAVADIAQTLTVYLPVESWQEPALKGLAMRPVCTATSVAVLWALLSASYTILAIVVVAAGITDASVWPALFGNWSDAYTVRRFWGRTWHQMVRRFVSAYGDFVTYRLLRLKKDTFIATNIHRHVAFLMSGIFHSLVDYGILYSKFWEKHASLRFFLVQATVIMIEQEVGNMLGLKPSKWTRRAGYLWTFSWFIVTYLPYASIQFEYGVGYRTGIWETGSAANFLLTGRWNYDI